MPVYEVTTKQGLTLEFEGDNPPSDADIDYAVKQLQDEQTDKGFMGSFLPRPIAGAIDQAGIGVLQGFSELPGLPADLVGLGLQGMDYLGGRKTPTPNPLEMFGSQSIRSALGQDGLGLIPRSIPRNMVERGMNAVGQGVGSVGAAGGKGLLALASGAGGGLGAQTMKEVFPDSTIAPIVGGLLGGLGGARLAAKAPAPKAGVLDSDLDAAIKAGKRKPSLPNTMDEQADMMSEGGPVGPIRAPQNQPSPEAAAARKEALSTKRTLSKIDKARGKLPEEASDSLASLTPPKPDLVNRFLFNVGLADKTSAKTTALYNALKKVEDAEPGMMRDMLATATKHLAKGAINAKLGNPLGTSKAVLDLVRGVIKGSTNARLQEALDELETVVRTGEPVPTKGTAIKNEIKGVLDQFGPYREPAKRGPLK